MYKCYLKTLGFLQAYFQLEMEESSQKYLTINTHMGLYQAHVWHYQCPLLGTFCHEHAGDRNGIGPSKCLRHDRIRMETPNFQSILADERLGCILWSSHVVVSGCCT